MDKLVDNFLPPEEKKPVYHRATTSTTNPKVVQRELDRIALLKSSNIKRSILLPGESYNDFLDALHKSRKSRGQFEAERLVKNGWTPEKEKNFEYHARKCGVYFGEMTIGDVINAYKEKAEREAIAAEVNP